MGIADQLHDEIDLNERRRNEAAELVHRVMHANLSSALEQAETIGDAFRILVALVEDELTDITTQHFQDMAEAARRRGR